MCNIDIIPKFQFNIPEESVRVGEVLPQLINCYAATTNPSEDDQTQNSIASILIQVLTQEKFRQVFISEENPYKNENVRRYHRPQRSKVISILCHCRS